MNFGVEKNTLISNSNTKGHKILFVYLLIERDTERRWCLDPSVCPREATEKSFQIEEVTHTKVWR